MKWVCSSSASGARSFSMYRHGLCRSFLCCSRTRALSACSAGAMRRLRSTQNLIPLLRIAAIISQQSSSVIAIGFSQKTCLPRFAASRTIPLCMSCGVETLTKSTSGSSRTLRQSVTATAPGNSRAAFSADAANASQQYFTNTSSLCFRFGMSWSHANPPHPICPITSFPSFISFPSLSQISRLAERP